MEANFVGEQYGFLDGHLTPLVFISGYANMENVFYCFNNNICIIKLTFTFVLYAMKHNKLTICM